MDSVEASLGALQKWVEGHDYKGYDPGDGLTSWLRPLTFGNLLAERVLQQVIWKSPWNIRPLVGVKPLDASFPSGHTAASFAAATALTSFYPRAAPLVFTLAAGVGLSRIYLGHHFPSDVAVGAATGAGIGGIVAWGLKRPIAI
jgi:membrane-associated phospholipid phosphatase